MRRIICILAVFTLVLTVMAPEQVIADTTSQRDAVYASEDKPHGNGVARDGHIMDSSDVIKSEIGSLHKYDNQQNQLQTISIESTCAWKDIIFRDVYLTSVRTKIGWMEKNEPTSQELTKLRARYEYLLKLASSIDIGVDQNENTANNSESVPSSTIQNTAIYQNIHDFNSGYDSSAYEKQNISVSAKAEFQSPINGNSCRWAELQNLNGEIIPGDKSYTFSNEFALVLPAEGYSHWSDLDGFPCNVPIYYFCSDEIEVFDVLDYYGLPQEEENNILEYRRSQSRRYIEEINTQKYNKPYVIFANSRSGHEFTSGNLFFAYDGNIIIGNGNHKIWYNAFLNTPGNIYIGDGNHYLDEFNYVKGNLYIGEGNHVFGQYSFQDTTGDITIGNCVMLNGRCGHEFQLASFKGSRGNIRVGNGDHLFSGDNAFSYTSGDIYIGKGNHTFTGGYIFSNAKGNIEIDDSEVDKGHEFYGFHPFSGTSGNISIGNGNHLLSSDYTFRNTKGKYIIIGNGDHKFIGKSMFGSSNTAITIGNGSHTFGENSFNYNTGNIYIGNGDHIFHRGAFIFNKSKNVIIGDGNITFLGSNNFIYSTANYHFGLGNIILNGDDSLNNSHSIMDIKGILAFYDPFNGLQKSSSVILVRNFDLDSIENQYDIDTPSSNNNVFLSHYWSQKVFNSYADKYDYGNTAIYMIIGKMANISGK